MRVRFDRFELDFERRELLADRKAVHLSPKAFLLLQVLAGAAPRAVSKAELTDAIWPDTFVADCNLPGLVLELRDALDDDARQARFIRTVHGFGYAFCAHIHGAQRREQRASVILRGHELPLYDGENVIGRESSATIQINDGTVSRRHACISVCSGSATVADLGSKNGTYVNNLKVAAPVALEEGDTILVGDVVLMFTDAGTHASTKTLPRASTTTSRTTPSDRGASNSRLAHCATAVRRHAGCPDVKAKK